MIYKITKNVKQGGIWDGKKLVKEFETEDKTLAEHFRKQGCTIEEVEVTLEKLNATQLKKYAKDNGIDIGATTTKEEILKVINAALNADPEE